MLPFEGTISDIIPSSPTTLELLDETSGEIICDESLHGLLKSFRSLVALARGNVGV
jgi:hypothetical protein